MISLENAKRLREMLGIKAYMDTFPCRCINCCGGDSEPECIRRGGDNDSSIHADGYFSCAVYEFDNLPALSQLLQEIEKEGYSGEISWDNSSVDCYCCCYGENWKIWEEPIWSDSPEDAVALALIAILKDKEDDS